MELAVLWLGFFGAWFLFAGPIYQATLELQEQDIEYDRIRATGKNIRPAKKISAWWWLLPPVKYVMELRRSKAMRRAYLEALLPEDAEALVAFFNKATGWLFVAIGGLLIAIKETFELAEHNGWGDWLFWGLIALMLILSLLNTASRTLWTRKVLASKK